MQLAGDAPDSDGMYGLLGPNGAGKSRILAHVERETRDN
jgi:ABC-type multidrug transport system ATPase subunit